MNESLNLSDLFYKIGVLAVENDHLVSQNAELHRLIEALEAELEAIKSAKRARKPTEATT